MKQLHPMTTNTKCLFCMDILSYVYQNEYYILQSVAFLLLAVLYTLKNFKKFYKQETNDQDHYMHQTDHISKMSRSMLCLLP